MRYYAVLDPAERDVVRNVFLVDDTVDPIVMVVFDHAEQTWVQNTALIEFVAGPRARDCVEVEADQAAELMAGWGAALPTEEAARSLARAAGGST